VSRPANTAATRVVDGPLRLARSISAALVCTVTAALGHLAGGGVIPTDVALLAFAGCFSIGWLLSTHRVTSGQLLGLLVLCQVCVHFGSSTSSMDMSALMMATHIIATVVSAGILTRGEALAWHLAERLGLRAVPALVRARPVPALRPIALVHRSRSLTNVFLAHSRVERGPPIASS
jgi:hypothetical protein